MQKYSDPNHTPEGCAESRRAIQDTLEVINGKWKLLIIMTLNSRPYRFKELAREIGISPRMLSKELQDMEANHLVTRTVLATKPISVEYALTEYARTFREVLDAMKNWGMKHRDHIIHGAAV